MTLHETAAFAERRATARHGHGGDRRRRTGQATVGGGPDDDADALLDLGSVGVGTSAAAWATALWLLTAPRAAAPAEPPPPAQAPLAPAELEGVEAVLADLRLDALIETLDRSGAIGRSAVDKAFLCLSEERFIAEAPPVVGAAVARRVVTDLLET